MRYTYQDFKDKSKEGIKKEVSKGLGRAAAYFLTTHGLPFEEFEEKIMEMNDAEKLLWYMNFRNKNKKLFN